jgi:spore coat protein A, manganese oxidase
MAGMAASLPLRFGKGWAYDQSPAGLRKFIQPLPGLGPTGIPVATPDTTTFPGSDYYRIVVGEYTQQLHPDLPPTKLWGYADVTAGQTPNHRYLGGVIVAKKGRPVRLTVTNNLPGTHPLPVDTSENFPDAAVSQNRISLHLHGGLVPWVSDGGPNAWFDPNGTYGVSAKSGSTFFTVPDMPSPAPGSFHYYYPNNQGARLMWYHDHAHDITRVNAYAGIASAYVITDSYEQSLISRKVLPSRQIVLVIQEKTFFDGADPNYIWGKRGDLWYPYKYEKDRWAEGQNEDPPAVIAHPDLPAVNVVPEFFGDTVVINGAVYPYVEVEPRHYRFRILNGSQARFFNLQIYYASNSNDTEIDLKTLPDGSVIPDPEKAKAGPVMVQIGTEGGFLPAPVALNHPPVPIGFDPETGNAVRYNLLMAPAERVDLVIDFSNVPVGSKLILYNDTPAPFPGGDDRNDYYTGDPDRSSEGGAPATLPGSGPNTRTLLQFRVVPLVGKADPPMMNSLMNSALQGSRGPLQPIRPLDRKKAVTIRDLTLNEDFDDYGRLIQRLGTNEQSGKNNQGLPTRGRNYMDDATETPHAGDIEVWRVFNLTGDTHPIHFHLVNVQILSRQPFDVEHYDGTPTFTGDARPPDANEMGWKETVRMNPGEMTEVIMKFDLPKLPFAVPESPVTGGYEYVWHCHILEHEEHDMMRPLVVK